MAGESQWYDQSGHLPKRKMNEVERQSYSIKLRHGWILEQAERLELTEGGKQFLHLYVHPTSQQAHTRSVSEQTESQRHTDQHDKRSAFACLACLQDNTNFLEEKRNAPAHH